MVNKLLSHILAVSCIGLLCCCQTSPLTPQKLENYVLDPANGLVQRKVLGAVSLQMQYRPTDLLVAQELRGGADPKTADALRAKYNSQAYFVLRLSQDEEDPLNNPENRGRYSEILQNLSFRMGQFVEMTTSKQDTIPLGDFAFPRLYGYGGSTQVLLAFNRSEVKEADWLQISLQDFGINTGKQHFRFYQEDLKQVPPIAFGSVVD